MNLNLNMNLSMNLNLTLNLNLIGNFPCGDISDALLVAFPDFEVDVLSKL